MNAAVLVIYDGKPADPELPPRAMPWAIKLRPFGAKTCEPQGERRGVSPPVEAATGGLTPRRSPCGSCLQWLLSSAPKGRHLIAQGDALGGGVSRPHRSQVEIRIPEHVRVQVRVACLGPE